MWKRKYLYWSKVNVSRVERYRERKRTSHTGVKNGRVNSDSKLKNVSYRTEDVAKEWGG